MQLNFTNEYLNLLLLFNGLVLILFLYSRKKKKKRAVKFGNYETLEKITDGSLLNNNNLLFITRILALTALIIGISNPVLVEDVSTPSENYVIALDSSASMFTSDVTPTRFEAAKQVGKDFIERTRPPTKTGLVAYAGTVDSTVGLTSQKEDVITAINDLEIGEQGGTDIAQAIRSSTSLLIEEDGGGRVILVTDGENTGRDSLNSSITFASSHNVSVYTVGIGRTNDSERVYRMIDGENISAPAYPNLDREQLSKISSSTGGESIFVSNRSELEEAFLDISTEKQERDISNLFILFSAVLLVLEWVLHSTDLEVIP